VGSRLVRGSFQRLKERDEIVDDYNREAFLTALRATGASSFQEARSLLAEIAEDRITSPDVAKYVEFCNDLTRYCLAHGIQRGSDITPWSVLVNADKEKAARTIFGRWLQRGVIGPVVSVVEGGWLAVRLRAWFKLQERLLAEHQPRS
jgi:hypothetical protein